MATQWTGIPPGGEETGGPVALAGALADRQPGFSLKGQKPTDEKRSAAFLRKRLLAGITGTVRGCLAAARHPSGSHPALELFPQEAGNCQQDHFPHRALRYNRIDIGNMTTRLALGSGCPALAQAKRCAEKQQIYFNIYFW